MARLRRIALGLLVAYAASMTLYASRMSAEVFLYRRIMERGPQADRSRMSASDPLVRTAKDYGADLTPLEYWAVRIADIQGLLLGPLIVLFFLIGLGAGLIPSLSPSRSNFDKD
jgi:hypothetical protein